MLKCFMKIIKIENKLIMIKYFKKNMFIITYLILIPLRITKEYLQYLNNNYIYYTMIYEIKTRPYKTKIIQALALTLKDKKFMLEVKIYVIFLILLVILF